MTDHRIPGEASRDPASRERELLSALMDGEAGEHELRQALKAAGEDPALLAAWSRWHLAQSVLRGENVRPAGIDLRAAVAAAIDGEPVPQAARRADAAAPAAWLKPLAGFAVAATVAAVTVIGWQGFRGAGDADALAAAGESQTVALGPMVMVREDGEELVVPVAGNESPTAGQDRLNAYLARHAQASSLGSTRSMSPYARVVSFEGEAQGH
ncbi:MAG: sigma-E factor negative regulatory protein [Pseudomonadota bacterium]